MRIVIDLQGAQTESRYRGIGRYALSLTRAIIQNKSEHEIILALNGLFPDTVESIRAVFDDILPQKNIRVWYAPGPVRECEPKNERRRKVAENIREAFFVSLKPDVILISSLFEGYVDDAVTSIGVFDTKAPVAVVLYDLIPLLNPESYLKSNSIYAEHYQRKIAHLKRADKWLAISEATADEGRKNLGVPAGDVINISAACDEVFRPAIIPDDAKKDFLGQFGCTQPFILYSGSADSRKNLRRLIQAYAVLSKPLCDAYQLLLVGRMSDGEMFELKGIAESSGIDAHRIIFTGYVSDEKLARLYNLCTVFVLPSLHEGFGLPALEAMSCGAAVIGANTTSVPEVIGLQDALFDPHDEASIGQKLSEVLGDKAFREKLIVHGLAQSKKFSWNASAKVAITALEILYAERRDRSLSEIRAVYRPKLAYVSPLPPERSGISDYSAELLPELATHYDIDVIVSQQTISDPWIKANCPIRSVEWFRQNVSAFDRVLYHFGNSPFHSHMFELLRECPGVVVLHDFFLGGVLAYDEMTGNRPRAWVDALYLSHGYQAVQMRFYDGGISKAKEWYPANLEVLQNALGVIVHSKYSKHLARLWYGKNAADDWGVIPLLRAPALKSDKLLERRVLNLKEDDFVVCSFGILAPSKLNQRLLDAWLQSSLSRNERCRLVFVGENHGGEYGAELLKIIGKSDLGKRVSVTGWTNAADFRRYLVAADMAVQLRTLSRGETSAAVLDCMNYALPTIVNANGSMAELPTDAVWMLPDEFTDGQLVDALETLWQDSGRRKQLASRAREVISIRHNPDACAGLYVQTIESMYRRAETGQHALLKAVASLDNLSSDNTALELIAKSVAVSFLPEPSQHQLLVDISNTIRHDLKSGIERVVRAQLIELIDNPPDGFKVEPVYLTNEGGEWHYRYARSYTSKILGIQQTNLHDVPVDIGYGDVFYGLDFFPSGVIEAAKSGIYAQWKAVGLSINFLVYDLLPILKPEFFPDDVDILHSTWLKVISQYSSRLICISNAVADELRLWLKKNMPVRGNQPMIGSVHLGADIDASLPSMGFSDDVKHFLNTISAVPTFVMVSTLEPRKGYLQTLAAFDLLWKQGHQINLLIVGKEGWMFLPDDRRRTIPELVKKIRGHAEYKRHLFWLESASDEFLEKIYSASICLIFASEGEGFGLPLIEAARHGLPIIARDIPVFREVAGEHAFYFDGLKPSDLSAAISDWLELNTKGKAPQSTDMPWLTWRQSTQLLLDSILSKSSVCGFNKRQQTSIITVQNERIPFRKYGRSPYFRKLMHMFISMALRSRFKKPLKNIYFALRLDRILY